MEMMVTIRSDMAVEDLAFRLGARLNDMPPLAGLDCVPAAARERLANSAHLFAKVGVRDRDREECDCDGYECCVAHGFSLCWNLHHTDSGPPGLINNCRVRIKNAQTPSGVLCGLLGPDRGVFFRTNEVFLAPGRCLRASRVRSRCGPFEGHAPLHCSPSG